MKEQGYTAGTSTLRFPPYVVDASRLTLTRDGVAVDLLPRYIEILAFLVSRAGEVISKALLLDTFWPNVNVSDNVVEQVIGAIRHALGDDPADPRFIVTVKRKGYRFIAIVEANTTPPQLDALEEWEKHRLSLETLNAEQLNEAAATFERILAANEGYAPAHAAVANACFLRFEVTRPEATPDYSLLERAIAHARQAIALDPCNAEAWAVLGLALVSIGEANEAHGAARQATILDPSSWRHAFRLARASWGDERLAAVVCTLRLLPGFAPARFVSAMVFIARGAFPDAEERAAAGAARQSQDAESESPFPGFGLHWLLGLLLLRKGDVTQALVCFEREMSDTRRTSIYFREYLVNALGAAGYAHLHTHDHAAALKAFYQALEIFPSNARALIGLQQALTQSGQLSEAAALASRIEGVLDSLQQQRRVGEFALAAAALDVARGHLADAAARLERLLRESPPGQVGWMIPIDPALAPLRDEPYFERVLTRLASRAS